MTSNGGSRLIENCGSMRGGRRGGGDAGEVMHKDPKFWALAVGLFILLSLAVVNIIEKVNMLVHLTENG
jgi:hypothetical protein